MADFADFASFVAKDTPTQGLPPPCTEMCSRKLVSNYSNYGSCLSIAGTLHARILLSLRYYVVYSQECNNIQSIEISILDLWLRRLRLRRTWPNLDGSQEWRVHFVLKRRLDVDTCFVYKTSLCCHFHQYDQFFVKKFRLRHYFKSEFPSKAPFSSAALFLFKIFACGAMFVKFFCLRRYFT